MRILIVSRRFYPFLGGIEFQLWRAARELVVRGHQVTVLTGRFADTLPVEDSEGVHIIRLPDPPVRGLRSLLFLAALTRQMIRLRKFYDVVLTTQINETSTAAIKLAHTLNKPVACYPSSIGPLGNLAWTRGKILGPLYRKTLEKVDMIIGQ
ncbi:MAG: hypothetical protein D6820_01695, partial [Lentisphaerae bacterium]